MVFGDFSTEGCVERQILEALPLGLILKSTISRKCLGVLLLRHTDLEAGVVFKKGHVPLMPVSSCVSLVLLHHLGDLCPCFLHAITS